MLFDFLSLVCVQKYQIAKKRTTTFMPRLNKQQIVSTPARKQHKRVENSTAAQPYDLSLDFITANYQPISKYCLSHINSIIVSDGKIYNLLDNTIPKRLVKCRCLKSNCEAKYCECFRSGEVCGEQCGCQGCKNRMIRSRSVKKVQEGGCNCVKSGCLKKYCECVQNGRKCSDKCKCCNCHNHL